MDSAALLYSLREQLDLALIALAKASNEMAAEKCHSAQIALEWKKRLNEAEEKAAASEKKAAEGVQALEELGQIAARLQAEVLDMDKEKIR